MMYIADLVVINAVNKAIEHLRQNPDELEFLFTGYMCLPDVAKLTGGYKYVKQIMEVIQGVGDKKLNVQTYYNVETSTNYDLYVIDSGSESDMFMGDQGNIYSQCIEPTVYLTADASVLSSKSTLKFLKTTCACDIIFVGMIAKARVNGCDFEAKVLSISFDANGMVDVELDKPIPKNGKSLVLKGWQFISPNPRQIVNTHASLDRVNVSLMLRTAGDIEIHKLFSIVVRYALKSQRPYLEANGIQISSVSRGPAQEENSGQNIFFTTQFSLTGKAADHWIYQKNIPPDKMQIAFSFKSNNPSNEEVLFGNHDLPSD